MDYTYGKLPARDSSTREVLYPLHYESVIELSATAGDVFRYLDDPNNLIGHMSNPTWQMGGGRMRTKLDYQRGQQVGSKIEMSGSVLGLDLSVTEVVVERVPPRRKSWETLGEQHLLVVESYRMGFEVTPGAAGTLVRVFIDYALPRRGASKVLGRLLGGFYAKWCTDRMAKDAANHFRSGN